MDYAVIVPFLVYFLIILLIGFFSAKFSSKGIEEYFLGGRKMGILVVALSAVVSGRSAWLLLGFTGQAYTMGLSAIWAVAGYIVVEFFLFLFYAPRIRKYTEENQCLTIPDFFAARFKDEKGYLRILIVSIILIFLISYIASQFMAGGKAFFAYFGMEKSTGLVLTAVIVLIYTMLGGYMAVSYTDVFQAFVMLAALIGLPLFGIIHLGGWSKISHDLIAQDPAFFNLHAFGMGSIIGLLGIGLGSPGSPHILVRYMSIKNPLQLKYTAILGTIWNIFMALGALTIGFIGRAYFPDILMIPGEDPENIYISLAKELLPAAFVGILLASVFAAIMSTADSQLLVASSGIVRDIYEKMLMKYKQVSQKKLALYSRIAVTLFVYLAIAMAFLVKDLVFWFVLFAWAGLGAAFGPTSILALFWKKTSRNGVIAGMITGTLIVIIWKSSPELSEWMYELIPGFLISGLVTYWVSEFEYRIK
jgi:sodium/proline symporter